MFALRSILALLLMSSALACATAERLTPEQRSRIRSLQIERQVKTPEALHFRDSDQARIASERVRSKPTRLLRIGRLVCAVGSVRFRPPAAAMAPDHQTPTRPP